ncbi:hypothetical protein JYU34_002117 [Plutella xylostella]|uniref:Uncharacterized protein n=1 Tax=Plutella xylostella TaxID=51655 RepID=A0ABQ7R1F8_PLUXY|nr:hypothetical protein JYU34_002117 [Plutella xylostella]
MTQSDSSTDTTSSSSSDSSDEEDRSDAAIQFTKEEKSIQKPPSPTHDMETQAPQVRAIEVATEKPRQKLRATQHPYAEVTASQAKLGKQRLSATPLMKFKAGQDWTSDED